MSSVFKIGLTEGGLTSLDELTTPLPDPQWEYAEYRKMVRMGDGTMRGQGPTTILWSFPLIETAQIAQLEVFKTTDPIYIQTLDKDGTPIIVEVLSNWIDPRQDGSHKPGFVGYRFGLDLEMIVLSEVP